MFAPILYKRSTAPLADIIQKLGLLYHLHADDCQIYVSFKSSPDEVSAALAKLEDCASEIYAWMAYNKLKLNCEKTGFLVIHAKHCPCPPIDEITIAGVKVEKSIKARNIGVMIVLWTLNSILIIFVRWLFAIYVVYPGSGTVFL